MERTIRIIGNLSAIIGIIVFIYPLFSLKDLEFTILQKNFISLSIIIFLAYLVYELFNTPTKYKNDQQIKKYMDKWINKTGRTVVFTRDMSWANNTQTKDHLREKARNQELIVCLPKITSFTTELERLGAEIYIYPNLTFTPKSRFTFINYDTPYSKVAIGMKDSNHTHYIKEYSINNTVEYFLAEDLVNLIKSL